MDENEKFDYKDFATSSMKTLWNYSKQMFQGIKEDYLTPSLGKKTSRENKEQGIDEPGLVFLGYAFDFFRYGLLVAALSYFSCQCSEKINTEGQQFMNNMNKQLRSYSTSEHHQPSDTTYTDQVQHNSSDISWQVFEKHPQSQDNSIDSRL